MRLQRALEIPSTWASQIERGHVHGIDGEVVPDTSSGGGVSDPSQVNCLGIAFSLRNAGLVTVNAIQQPSLRSRIRSNPGSICLVQFDLRHNGSAACSRGRVRRRTLNEAVVLGWHRGGAVVRNGRVRADISATHTTAPRTQTRTADRRRLRGTPTAGRGCHERRSEAAGTFR